MPSAPSVPIDDYEAIQAAVMETARGRWFLAEYARRNRNADTERVLEAIERVAHMAGSPAERNLEIADLVKFAQDARRAMIAVHETTGSAPVDFIVDTMLTMEERLEAICGRTRAAAKLVAIAEVKPVLRPVETPAAHISAESEPKPAVEPAEPAGPEIVEAPVIESIATPEPDAIETAPAALEAPPAGVLEPIGEEEEAVFVVEPSPLWLEEATGKAESEPEAAPAALEPVPSLAALEEAVAALALQVDESRKITAGPADEEDDEDLFTTPWAPFPHEARAPRKPLPASLRPDLPLVTAAELDALSFEEKIVLFA